jgi:hypothetical protein
MNLSKKTNMFPLSVIFPLLLLALPWTGKAQSLRINPEKIVDLTHDFDSSTVYWPNAKPFDWQKEFWISHRADIGTLPGIIPPASMAERISMLPFISLAVA